MLFGISQGDSESDTPTPTPRPQSLDHIPHWDDAKAMPYVEKSYVPYHITLEIPDVKCEKVRGCLGWRWGVLLMMDVYVCWGSGWAAHDD